jgi:hypothetical protein
VGYVSLSGIPPAWGQFTPRFDEWSNVMILTITRVEGNTVFGSMELYGRFHRVFGIRGTLQGNDLTFGRARYQLRVDGTRLTGHAQAGEDGWDIELNKR